MSVLVTGANGNISSQTIALLRNQNIPVRAVVRDPAKGAALKEAGCDVVVADLGKSVDPGIFEGVTRALFLTAPGPEASDQMHHLIEAAKGSGVHVVRLSAIGAAADAPTDNGRQHFASDEELRASGLTYTILRPSWFMQNIMWGMEAIGKEGRIYQAMADGRIGMVDVRDVADVAAKILADGGHEDDVLTLTGPSSIDWNQFANAVGDAVGREVTYVPVPTEAVRQGTLDMGMGQWFADMMHDYSSAYGRGWGNLTTGDVEKVVGREARSAQEFCNEVLAPMLKVA